MSFKSGMIAARKQGMPVSGIQQGPRGGHFYFNSQGHKVYGAPPTPHMAEARQGSSAVPPHVHLGAKVHIDVEDEGWKAGTVTKIFPRKGVAHVELPDGRTAEAHFHEIKPHQIVTPPPTGKPPKGGGPPAHVAVGKHVEIDVEHEDGHTTTHTGTVIKVGKNHALVELHDSGDVAKEVFHAIRPAKGVPQGQAKDLSHYVEKVKGSTRFQGEFKEAIARGGFGPMLEQHKLSLVQEGLRGRALGVYRRRGNLLGYGGDTTQSIEIKGEAAMRDAHSRDMQREQHSNPYSLTPHEPKVMGPTVFTVKTKATGAPYHEYTQAVMVHELGHHLHLHGSQAYPGSEAQKTFSQVDHLIVDHYRNLDRDRFPSKYARTNHKEWFAEAHVAYVYHKEEFKSLDPQGFEVVRQVRKTYGMGE